MSEFPDKSSQLHEQMKSNRAKTKEVRERERLCLRV